MRYRSWFLTLAATLLSAFAIGLVCIVYAVHIVKQPGFYQLIPDATLRVQETAFLSRDRHCDVLIYGDSTALTGVDPVTITAATGLSACNIAVTRPIVDTLGSWPIDEFLRHNAKPRFLVLQFGPELFFRTDSWDHVAGIAAFVLMVRQRPGWATDWAMISHPTMTVGFTQTVLKYTLLRKNDELARFELTYQKPFADYQTNGGLLNYVQPAETNCVFPREDLYGPADLAWLEALRHRYTSQGINVLVRAAPVPPCDPRLAQYRSALAPSVESNVQTLPVTYFNNGDRHLTPEGAKLSTQDIVHLLQAHGAPTLAQP